MDTQELIRMLREYAAKHYPDDDAESVVINLRKSGPFTLPMPKLEFSDEHDGLEPSEVLVLGYVPEKDKTGVTIEEIMRRSNYKNKSHMYGILRGLMGKGFITKDQGKLYCKTE